MKKYVSKYYFENLIRSVYSTLYKYIKYKIKLENYFNLYVAVTKLPIILY